jgi:AmmeMemoRadiSam system protein B/AmmeMemoRadiSam system protein A
VSRVRRAALAAAIIAAATTAIIFAVTEERPSRTRRPAVAGAFYSADAEELSRDVREMLSAAPDADEDAGRVVGLVVPHAGYVYSGQTAANAYKWLQDTDTKTVVVVGLSHRGRCEADIWVDDTDAYLIPGGKIDLDSAKIKALEEAGIPALAGRANTEHSIEVQLPFLREALESGWKLVPILVATRDPKRCRAAATAIKGILDDGTVICASSDFTHYGSDYGYVPFTGSRDELRRKIAKLDSGAIDLILKRDTAAFTAYCDQTKVTICGAGPIKVLLETLPSEAVGRKISYTTSGEITGDYSLSVSYAAIVFTLKDAGQGGNPRGEEKAMGETAQLTESEKATLLSLARAALEAAVTEGGRPEMSGFEITPALEEKRGAFVTLKTSGKLRGCIGYVAPIKPLWEAVVENAANAALNDPRFNAVTESEVAGIDIEISAMTPLETVTDPEIVEVGKHGIMITRGMYRGLLLPQVATEYGWRREEFLNHTCRKAGLPATAWKETGTQIEVFSAEVFGEKEAP